MPEAAARLKMQKNIKPDAKSTGLFVACQNRKATDNSPPKTLGLKSGQPQKVTYTTHYDWRINKRCTQVLLLKQSYANQQIFALACSNTAPAP